MFGAILFIVTAGVGYGLGWSAIGRRALVRLAVRFRRQRNQAQRRTGELWREKVLADLEVNKWKGAAYTLGAIVKSHEEAIEYLKQRLDKAEMAAAKTKIPDGI